MRKRIISLLLCLVMVLSLIPTVAFAEQDNATESQTTNGAYDSQGIWTANTGNGSVTTNDGLTLSKTATHVSDNTYRIDLSVVTTQEVTTQDSPAAVALVIDTSGSMAWCSDYHKHSDDCYKNSVDSVDRCGPISDRYDHWFLGFHKADTSCRLMNGKDGFGLYPASCGTKRHTHDGATGGSWCGNSELNKDTDSRIANAKAAATAFISSFKSTSAARYVAVVSFASKAASSDWFNVSTEDGYNNAIAAINKLGANGGTDMAAGLSSANTLMSATPNGVEASNRHVILLSDGAPTYANGDGNGSSGSADINAKTSTAAATLKNAINPGKLYTICFSAENEICYSDYESNGPTVGEFLRKSIASSTNDAYKAETATELNNIFTNLSSSITTGLTGDGWTVTDPMARNITVVGTLNGYDAATNTYTWTLSNPTETPNGNTTTYTYTTSYTVTIDPNGTEADGTTKLSENKFYPTNGVTELKYKNANNEPATANFPVPGVKVKLPDPTPTTGSLTINKVLAGDLVATNFKEGFSFTVLKGTEKIDTIEVWPGNPQTLTLEPAMYTIVENNAEVDGYELTTSYKVGNDTSNTGNVNVTANGQATVTVTNTYKKVSTPPAEEVPVDLTITKNVIAKVGSTLPKNLPSFTFKAYLGEKEVGTLTLALKEETKVPNAQNQYRGILTANIPAADFADGSVVLTIKEVNDKVANWKYDTKEYKVLVNENGTYTVNPQIAARATSDQEPERPTLTFTNEYSYKYTPIPMPTTPKPVTSVKTGDMGVALYAVTSLLSLSGAAVIIKKRKDEE